MSAHLNMPQLIVTKEYRDSFMAADFMFKYQPVFDPFKRCIVPLNPFPDDEVCENKFKELLAINDLSEEQSRQLAYGNLDPFTLAQMDDWEPGQVKILFVSYIEIFHSDNHRLDGYNISSKSCK